MSITERAERLAANLLADRERQRERPKHDIVACWSCGTTYVYRGRQGDLNGNFCSMRCQDWYDDGNPSFERQRELSRVTYTYLDGRPMRAGRDGFYIACKHCNKEFESLGLRCCSTDCERSYRESQERRAVLKEVGIEPTSRRMCERVGCDRPIPKWKNGRQVSSKVRFCSDLCRKRAAKAA
jgi:hypothetical protein